jgi:ABC-type polysaccharide/polyol phosphate export permease
MSTPEIETGPDQPSAAADVKLPPKRRQPAHHELEWELQQHVYEPHSVGLPPIRPYFRELWRRREFAMELARTKLRSQHFDTAFGKFWLVLNPLLLSAVYFVLIDIVRGGRSGNGFFAHLVAGIFAYTFVAGAARSGVKSVVSGGKLIMNSAFPRVLLPLSSVITGFKQFMPTMIIYIPIHLISGLPVGLQLLWVIPLTLMLTVLAAGLCMLVAALQVYFRDLRSLLPYVLRIWLYASPVLYYASRVPERYKWLLYANPLGAPLSAWSRVLHGGLAPEPWQLGIGGAWALLFFVFSLLFFMSREREFAVRL